MIDLVSLNSVSHLAGKLVQNLKSHQKDETKEDYITSKDIFCVQIAGLCHDLGEIFTVH